MPLHVSTVDVMLASSLPLDHILARTAARGTYLLRTSRYSFQFRVRGAAYHCIAIISPVTVLDYVSSSMITALLSLKVAQIRG